MFDHARRRLALMICPELKAQTSTLELDSLAWAPIWKNGRRPDWWKHADVRAFLFHSHRQMSILDAERIGQERFGDRCPKKTAIGEFWLRLDTLRSGSGPNEVARHG